MARRYTDDPVIINPYRDLQLGSEGASDAFTVLIALVVGAIAVAAYALY